MRVEQLRRRGRVEHTRGERRRQRTGPRGRERVDHQRAFRFARVAPGNPPHLLGRRAPALHDGRHHRVVTEQSLHARERAVGPVVRGLVAAPEPELPAVGGHDLVGNEPQQRETARRRVEILVVLRVAEQPTVELPAHPLGQRGGSEHAVVTPAPREPFTVLGLGLDHHARARQAALGEAEQQPLGERLRRERDGVDPLRPAGRARSARPDPAAG